MAESNQQMKTQKEENFPVACKLFSPQNRVLITHYYNFARACDDIADNPSLTTKEKNKQLDDAENTLFNNGHFLQAQVLREDFIKEKLDFSLATDLLVAFKRDAINKPYKTWAQLLDYCRYSAEPVGRFMLALHNENPSTYLPASALCTVLQLTNHIQDLRSDIFELNRNYLPEELLKKHKVSQKSLLSGKSSKSLQNLTNDILNRCRYLLKDARILPSIIKNRRLNFYICVTISLTDILINKLYNKDVMSDKVVLSKVDWLKAGCIGLYKTLTTKRKTLANESL